MSSTEPDRQDWTRTGLPAAAIALATVWVFWPALRGAWLLNWDDGLEVVQNPMLRSGSGWWRTWVQPTGMDYFPLKSTLQWVQWRFWGGATAGYHAFSIGLHLLNALLVWRILGRLGVRCGWLGGFLFAVHPVTVESVAWISEQKNTLSLAFLLLALLSYLRGSALAPAPLERGGPGGRVVSEGERAAAGALHLGAYLLSLALFLASMLCKSTVVMFPFVLLLLAWWRRGRIGRADLAASAPFFLVSAVLGAVTWTFQQHRAIGISGPMPGLESRLTQAGWSLAAYVREAVVPSGLMPIYPPVHSGAPAVLPWLALAALIGFLIRKRAGWGRHVLLGVGWFLINLVPVLGLAPMSYLRVSPRADHLAYVPLIGLIGLAAAGADLFLLRPGLVRRLCLGLGAAGAIAALAAASRTYASVFHDEASLWSCAVDRNPDSWLARNNYGLVLMKTGRPGDAAVQFESAARLGPESAEVRANLGNAYAAVGRTDEARIQFGESLRIEPGFAGAHYGLGCVLLKSGDVSGAAGQFRAALGSDPTYAVARNNLGLALVRQGRTTEAIFQFEQALRDNPGLAEAQLNLGNAYFREGHLQEAAGAYRAALRLAPSYAAAHHNLGYALEQLGRESEAQAEFRAALNPPEPREGTAEQESPTDIRP